MDPTRTPAWTSGTASAGSGESGTGPADPTKVATSASSTMTRTQLAATPADRTRAGPRSPHGRLSGRPLSWSPRPVASRPTLIRCSPPWTPTKLARSTASATPRTSRSRTNPTASGRTLPGAVLTRPAVPQRPAGRCGPHSGRLCTGHALEPTATLRGPHHDRQDIRTLVAYFSRAGENHHYRGPTWLEVGNTEVVVGLLAALMEVDVYRIVPAEPYPSGYEETVAHNGQMDRVKRAASAALHDADVAASSGRRRS